jgi:hypothetical protein
MGGLTVVGLLMAGWSSFNKYSLLGGLRSAAQIISYEIPLTLSVVGVIILAGTMSLNGIVLAQSGSLFDWFVFKQPLAALIFFIAATAEANRTPFDMTEADSEIVAGFATEYSGMRFGFFFFAEYVNVFIVSALVATIFFGGWTAPFNWPWAYNLNWFHPLVVRLLRLARHRSHGRLLRDRSSSRFSSACSAAANGACGPRWGWASCSCSSSSPSWSSSPASSPSTGSAASSGSWPRPTLRHHLRLDAGDAAARPGRPADGLRLEMAAARLASQPLRDGHRRRPLNR